MSLPSAPILLLPPASALDFGKYRLIAKLGQGGMAEVFLAAHRGPGGFEKLVVIKRSKPYEALDPDVQATLVDEARIIARLNHPNVVQTYECGVVDEVSYLAMEYLEGQPLDRILHRLGRGGHLAAHLAIVSDALAGLHHAHEATGFDGSPLLVVHRDVSPHNLFVTYEGQTKVVDFGIAKWAVQSSQTSTGVVKGKVGYMAPEQALCAPVDRRADLFAVGVILWEIAAGERFWGNLSEVQILKNLALGELYQLNKFPPDVPEALHGICARALAMKPEDRYANAAEMRDDLESVLAELGRPSASEVGRMIAEAFADRRAEAKAVIGAQLGRLDEADGDRDEDGIPVLDDRAGPPSVRGRSLSRREASGRVDAAAAREATPSAAVADAPVPPAAPAVPAPRRSPGVALVALVGGAVAGAALFAALRGGDAPAATVADAAPPALSAEAAPGQLIELRIGAAPEGAKIFLDDVPAPSNPFVARFPRDGTGHRVRVEAEGYAPEARFVVFERDVDVHVSLSRAAPAASSEASPPAPGAGPPPAPLVTSQPAPVERPLVAEPPAPAVASDTKPASDRAPPPPSSADPVQQGPKVDTSDPWGAQPR